MEEPDYIILKGACPKCGGQVVAYHDLQLNDGTEVWYIVCNNNECDYAHPDYFASLEALAQKFEAED